MNYRRLTILEIVYFNAGISIDANVEKCLLKQLQDLQNELLCVSIVVNGNMFEPERFHGFIRSLKELKIAMSISFYNCWNLEDVKSVKNEVGQIRISINEEVASVDRLPELYGKLKTSSNNVVFLFEIDHIRRLKAYVKLLESNNFLYNISYSSNLDYNSYWSLAKYVSDLKGRFPLKIFQEFTCAGVVFDNIKGICPAKTSLMCIGIDGNITYCYKDTRQHGINLRDGELKTLFAELGRFFPECSNANCSETEFTCCSCGCPIDFEEPNNLYCKYNYEGGVSL